MPGWSRNTSFVAIFHVVPLEELLNWLLEELVWNRTFLSWSRDLRWFLFFQLEIKTNFLGLYFINIKQWLRGYHRLNIRCHEELLNATCGLIRTPASFLGVSTIVSLRNLIFNLLRTVFYRMYAERVFNSPCKKLNMTVHSVLWHWATVCTQCVQSGLRVGFKPSSEHAPWGRDLGSVLSSFVSPIPSFKPEHYASLINICWVHEGTYGIAFLKIGHSMF